MFLQITFISRWLRVLLMLFASSCFVFGCSSLSSKKLNGVQEPLSHKILFVKDRWHTSLVIEAPALLSAMPQLASELNRQPYVRVGWGDGDFFSGKDKSNLSATRALFVSSYSAMQVLSYEYWPEQDFAEEKRALLRVSDSGLARLIEFISQSFVIELESSLHPLPAYRANTGSFYLAKERYSLFNNCNSWTGKALEAAGLPIGFHLTPASLLSDVKKIAAQQSQQILEH